MRSVNIIVTLAITAAYVASALQYLGLLHPTNGSASLPTQDRGSLSKYTGGVTLQIHRRGHSLNKHVNTDKGDSMSACHSQHMGRHVAILLTQHTDVCDCQHTDRHCHSRQNYIGVHCAVTNVIILSTHKYKCNHSVNIQLQM